MLPADLRIAPAIVFVKTKHAPLLNVASSQIGTPVMREVVFGDIGVNPDVVSPDPCGGSVPAAGALVLTFLLNNYQDPEYQQVAEQWEKEVRGTKQGLELSGTT